MAPGGEWRQEGETTHSERRLTDNDRALAETIDGLG
jgi:pterin-4a-carbinolamine dehydratase